MLVDEATAIARASPRATALAHGLGLATRNSIHFNRIPGLRVVTTLG